TGPQNGARGGRRRAHTINRITRRPGRSTGPSYFVGEGGSGISRWRDGGEPMKRGLAAGGLGLFGLAVSCMPPCSRADDAPPLPAYFPATNRDATHPAWPDQTGAALGTRAEPAGDGHGDVPAALHTEDVYDRVAHNLFSINVTWTLIAGFLVMFMQA